jgi:pyruvate dehydrogenase E2 component (dihydrolipoamide acetyltransferase)
MEAPGRQPAPAQAKDKAKPAKREARPRGGRGPAPAPHLPRSAAPSTGERRPRDRLAARQAHRRARASTCGRQGQRPQWPDRQGRRRGRAQPGAAPAPVLPAPAAPVAAAPDPDFGIPHEVEKLSACARHRPPPDRGQADHPAHLPHGRCPARRAAQAARRAQQGAGPRGIKLSVNDLLIKALAKALLRRCRSATSPSPATRCSASSAAPTSRSRSRCPSGLITPIIVDAAPRASPDRHRDEGARRQGARRQAAAARIPGRHRQPLQHGHVRDQAVRRGDQPAAGDDHGRRRGREAAPWSTTRSPSPP